MKEMTPLKTVDVKKLRERFSRRSKESAKEKEQTKERLRKTLGDLVSFQTIADGQHAKEIRGLFDYIEYQAHLANAERSEPLFIQEWDDSQGHIATIIASRDAYATPQDAIFCPKVAMLVHGDVVKAENPGLFTLSSATNNPQDDNVVGRGTLDMKGALAIGLDLLPTLPGGAALIVTSDEEVGGQNGAGKLVQLGVQPDFLIILDGQKSEHISFGAKGYWHAEITFTSLLHKGGHGSRYEDYSANELAADVRSVLRKNYQWHHDDAPEGVTMNAKVEGENGPLNKVAERAKLGIDMRFPTEEEKKTGKEAVKSALEEVVLQKMHEVYGETLPVNVVFSEKEKDGANVYAAEVIDLKGNNMYTLAQLQTLTEGLVYEINPQDKRIQRFIHTLQKEIGKPVAINDKKDTGLHDGRYWPHTPALVYLPKGSGSHTEQEQVSLNNLVELRQTIHKFLKKELPKNLD